MNTVNVKISRGEVFYVNSIFPTVGSEQKSGRPAVIVSNNLNNEHSECVEIVYLTLQKKTPLPTHIKIKDGVCSGSTVLCEQITTVSVERLGDYMCRLPDDTMDAIDKALIISLGLDSIIKRNEPVAVNPDSVTTPANTDDKDAQIKELMYHLECTLKELELAKDANKVIKEKAAKSAMYEQMYNDILEKLIRR